MLTAKELELAAFNIAYKFRSEYLKYDVKIYSIKNVKKSKWWPIFLKIAEKYANNNEWNCNLFIEAQFFTCGKIFPFELLKKEAWDNYLSYKQYKDNEDSYEVTLVKNILAGYKEVQKYCLKNNITFSVADYLSNTTNKNKIENNLLPNDFFVFSKYYNKLYDKSKISYKKIIARKNIKLMVKLKKILGDDFEQ